MVKVKPHWLVVFFLINLPTPGYNSQPKPPPNTTVYEIFVRSFYDSDGDGIGDLNGLRQKLDYLNDGNPQTDDDLEVGILWLMPIFPSVSYHGYDVNDYRSIHPDYGTLSDFDELIQAARERGIRIILDIPFNHTSNEHPWFKEAIENPQISKYWDYYFLELGDKPPGYDWHTTQNSAGEEIHYFCDFTYTMPDLNFSNPEVREEAKQIAEFWLERGAAGFRLDAAKHIFAWSNRLTPEEIQQNIDWWREFSDFVYSIDSSTILVGEILDSPDIVQQFASGLDAALDFHFKHYAREYVKDPYDGFLQLWKDYFEEARKNNSKFDLFPFLSSHDENPRLASFVEVNVEQDFEAAYRVAMYLLFTVAKYPILYYGDEIMQRGWKWQGGDPPHGDGSHIWDETLREPFQWYAAQSGAGQASWFQPRFDQPDDGISVEEQSPDVSSLLSLVRALTNFRAEHPDFANGEISGISEDSAEWLAFEKRGGDKTYIVFINPTSEPKEFQWEQYQNVRLLFWADGLNKQWKDFSDQSEGTAVGISIPPFGLVIMSK